MVKAKHRIRHWFKPPWVIILMCLGWAGYANADIAVIVHAQNPMATLDESDVRRIYMGRMRMFPGSSQGIETIDQPENAERFMTFYKVLMQVTPAKLKRQRASYLFSGKGRLPLVKEDDAAVKTYVASTPAAIGYVKADQVDDTVRVVATVKTE